MNTLNPKIFNYFSTLIEKETGIQYQEANATHLASRLNDLAKFLNFENVELMWSDIEKNGLTPVAKKMILDLATNNETYFFRDPEIFDFFKNEFILKSMNNKPSIKIWCAATSTGQEPYSLAIIMSELKAQGINKSYEIIATDISERVLKQASSGIYSQLEIQRGLPAAYMAKYFEQLPSESANLSLYRAKSELSAHISFKQLNILENWAINGPFDIIFCRNVLIYQNIENKKKAIARFADILTPGGYLVLGGAESILGLSTVFDLELHGKACVYKVKDLK